MATAEISSGICGFSATVRTQMEGIKVKLVEMPLTETVRRMFRPDVKDDYRKFLERLVADTGVEIVRVPQGLVGEDDFQDLEHLFPHGARKYSCWLAMDVARTVAEGRDQAACLPDASPRMPVETSAFTHAADSWHDG